LLTETQLIEFRKKKKEIQVIDEHIKALRETIGAKAASLNEPTKASTQGSETERTIERIMMLEERYEQLRSEYAKERILIEDEILCLEPNERALIRLYYLDGITMEEVAEKLVYSIAQIYNIRTRAILKLGGTV